MVYGKVQSIDGVRYVVVVERMDSEPVTLTKGFLITGGGYAPDGMEVALEGDVWVGYAGLHGIRRLTSGDAVILREEPIPLPAKFRHGGTRWVWEFGRWQERR